MKGDELDSEDVVAGRNARRHVEVAPSTVLDHVVDAPRISSYIEIVLSHLEEFQIGSDLSRSGVVNLGKPCRDRAVVRPRDRVVWIIGDLFASKDVSPPCSNLVTWRDGDDLIGCQGDLAAGHISIVDVLRGIILVRRTEADKLAIVLAVDRQFLEEAQLDVHMIQLSLRAVLLAWKIVWPAAALMQPRVVTRESFILTLAVCGAHSNTKLVYVERDGSC